MIIILLLKGNNMILSVELAIEIYDVLVQYAGANITEKDSFVDSHSNHREYGECTEWRFCGNLGFGGKYRSYTNTVDCYNEDLNNKTKKIIVTTNDQLQLVTTKYLTNKCKYLNIDPYNKEGKGSNHSFNNHYCSIASFGYCRHIEELINNVPYPYNCPLIPSIK